MLIYQKLNQIAHRAVTISGTSQNDSKNWVKTAKNLQKKEQINKWVSSKIKLNYIQQLTISRKRTNGYQND